MRYLYVSDTPAKEMFRWSDPQIVYVTWEGRDARIIQWLDDSDGSVNTGFQLRELDHRTPGGAPIHKWVTLPWPATPHQWERVAREFARNLPEQTTEARENLCAHTWPVAEDLEACRG